MRVFLLETPIMGTRFLILLFSTILLPAGVIDAFTAFQAKCTSPPENVTFVFSPPVRGTMSIIWSCFGALSLCTWAIQHLNVPFPVERPKKLSRMRRQLEKGRGNFSKLIWMGLTLAAPEFVLCKALCENIAANDSKKNFGTTDEAWTTTHAFFANMGGFVFRFNVAALEKSVQPGKATKVGRERFRLNPSKDPPYLEQDPEEAERKENELREAELADVTWPTPLEQGENETLEMRIRAQSWEKARQINIEPLPPTQPAVPRSDESQACATKLITSHNPPSPATLFNSPDPTLVDITPTTPNERHCFTQHSATWPFYPQSTLLEPPPPCKFPQQPHQPKLWKANWPLNALQIKYAYEKNIIPHPPRVTLEELKDRSKGDALVKTAAVLQITWLVGQILARAFENLAITLLEITVLAFATCATITYILLWDKPQDVQVPIYIDVPGILTRQDIIGLAARSPVSELLVHEFWLHGVAIRAIANNVFPQTPLRLKIPGLMKKPMEFNPVLIGMGFGGTIFGAVHFAAWNFDFPSPVERLLWRISCGLLGGFPLLATSSYVIAQHVPNRRSGNHDLVVRLLKKPGQLFQTKFIKPLYYALAPLYFGARLYMAVEIFRQLAYPSPGVFDEVDWPTFIPHAS